METALDPGAPFTRIRAAAERQYHQGGIDDAAVLTAHLAAAGTDRRLLTALTGEYPGLSAGLVDWAVWSAPEDATHLLTIDEVICSGPMIRALSGPGSYAAGGGPAARTDPPVRRPRPGVGTDAFGITVGLWALAVN